MPCRSTSTALPQNGTWIVTPRTVVELRITRFLYGDRVRARTTMVMDVLLRSRILHTQIRHVPQYIIGNFTVFGYPRSHPGRIVESVNDLAPFVHRAGIQAYDELLC